MKLRKKPVVIVDPYPWITTAEVEELLAATAIYESSDGVVDVTENHFAAFRSLAWEAIENRKAVADLTAQVERLTIDLQSALEVGMRKNRSDMGRRI